VRDASGNAGPGAPCVRVTARGPGPRQIRRQRQGAVLVRCGSSTGARLSRRASMHSLTGAGRGESSSTGARLSRRALLAGAGALASGGLLGACAGGTPASRRGPITLLLLGTGDAGLYQQMLPRFEAAHPGITVRLSLAIQGHTAALTAALLTGSGPDVLWDTDPAPYLDRPLLADLAPLAARDHLDLGDWPAPVLAAYRTGDQLFMLPRSVSPGAYAVRTDRLAAAGVEVPTDGYTAAELATIWQHLTRPGQVGGKLVWSPTSTFYLTGWGASLVEPADPARCALGRAAAITCGQWVWDRFWTDRSAQGLQGQNPAPGFAAGSPAMDVLPCAAAPTAAGAYQNLAWRLAPFPRWPAGPATFADSDFYAIPAASSHREAAWLLLTYLTSAEWGQAALAASLVCPARKSLWTAYLTAARQAAPPLRQQPLEIYRDAIQGGWTYPPQRFRHQQDAVAVLGPFWQQIFGPGSTQTVRDGFPAAAAAVDARERADARASVGTAGPLTG